jgi:hypothetical protein
MWLLAKGKNPAAIFGCGRRRRKQKGGVANRQRCEGQRICRMAR